MKISTFNGIDSIGLFTSQHADTPSSTPSALPFSPTSYVSNNYNNKNIVTTTTNTIVTQEAIKIQVDVNAEVNAAIRKSEQLVDTVTMSDIPAILKLLPESLQARFVDRLAEAVGSRLRNTTPSTAPSTATVTGTETIKPYWETMSLPSSTPVSNNMSSQSSLPPHTSASADTQSTRPWVPTVFTAPSILDQQYTAFQATRVFGTLVNGMKEPPVSNVTSNVQGSLSEGQIALRALANQFQLAAATVHLQGRMQAAAATNTNAAPSNAPESNEAFPY